MRRAATTLCPRLFSPFYHSPRAATIVVLSSTSTSTSSAPRSLSSTQHRLSSSTSAPLSSPPQKQPQDQGRDPSQDQDPGHDLDPKDQDPKDQDPKDQDPRDQDAASSMTPAERSVAALLAQKLQPTNLLVQDVSGGCGSMYAIQIESPLFRGHSLLRQQRMVNAALGDLVKSWHGLQIRTSVPPPDAS
ncbi:BolA protein [Ophiocordyceps sinensis CO18]|nr:BolA protein [Ophiocordyceps sinensis CO18]